MEVTLIGLISTIVVILNITLFYKIWVMTNNIQDLKKFYMHDKGIEKKELKDDEGYTFGWAYVDKDGKQIKII